MNASAEEEEALSLIPEFSRPRRFAAFRLE
jgi:hypothetical protein